VDIEADIVRRRQQLAETLDELAVRVHPKTIAGDARDKALAAVNRTAARAGAAAERTAGDVRAKFYDENGTLRYERVVGAALVGAAVIGGVCALAARRKRR